MVVIREGRVLFAKNSDRDPNEAQLLDWQPAKTWEPGEFVQCTWLAIPQVKRTYAVLLSRPFWMWGAEMGANEHGVAIGNDAVFTTLAHQDVGLTGMDMVRLALERCDTAEQAVNVIVELLRDYGQGGGCGHEKPSFTYHNSFLIADRAQAFVLETAHKYHAVERVTAGVRSISNRLTIDYFNDSYGDGIKAWGASAKPRWERTTTLGANAQTPRDMAKILRDHGAGREWPKYSRLNGAMSAPCVHAGGGLVANSQTTASWISELTPDGDRHWVTATSAPCTGLFKPVSTDEALDLPDAVDGTDEHSLWWRHEQLHRRVMRNPSVLLQQYRSERNRLESTWFENPVSSAEAFAEGDQLIERWLAKVAAFDVQDVRPKATQKYWQKRNLRAGLLLP